MTKNINIFRVCHRNSQGSDLCKHICRFICTFTIIAWTKLKSYYKYRSYLNNFYPLVCKKPVRASTDFFLVYCILGSRQNVRKHEHCCIYNIHDFCKVVTTIVAKCFQCMLENCLHIFLLLLKKLLHIHLAAINAYQRKG